MLSPIRKTVWLAAAASNPLAARRQSYFTLGVWHDIFVIKADNRTGLRLRQGMSMSLSILQYRVKPTDNVQVFDQGLKHTSSIPPARSFLRPITRVKTPISFNIWKMFIIYRYELLFSICNYANCLKLLTLLSFIYQNCKSTALIRSPNLHSEQSTNSKQ